MYTRIYGQQQLGKCFCVAGSQPMQKNSRKIMFVETIFVRFLCKKIIFDKNKANYGIPCPTIAVHLSTCAIDIMEW